jgi:uncharacterized repeat protein (TIGR01451 family)
MYTKDYTKLGLLLGWKRRVAVVLLLSATSLLWPASALAAFKSTLQGQQPGNTNWVNGPLNGWHELDSVPAQVVFTGGPASNQVITVSFDHTKGGTIPGIQNLFGFTNSPNVIFISQPTLSAPIGVDTWSYTFTVNVIDNQSGSVTFYALLNAGSHAYSGAALHLTLGTGQLQIAKPAVVLGSPDMAVSKTGPTQAKTNQIITYIINWTNKLISAQTALGVQVSDILPAQVSYVPGSASKGATIVGNMISWNLGNLPPGRHGTVYYKALVTNNIPVTTTFANFAQILCSQDDANPADNSSSVTTTVVVTIAVVANDDVYATGKDATLNVSAPGVLLNDSNALTASLLSAPGNGSVTFNSDGSFSYSPAAGFLGSDFFAYQAFNGTNASGPAVVTINVTNTCFLVSAPDFTTNNSPGQCGALVNYPPPVTTGDCATISCTPTNGSFFPVGATPVTCTNTDGLNASFNVKVLDTEPPVLTCPTNILLTADPGHCSRSNVTFVVTATDNCSVTNLVSVPPSGSTFPVGVTTVTNTATDSSGNVGTCTFTVTVNDTQPPTITCPVDLTVNADAGNCSATGVALGSPTTGDNCGAVTVTNDAPAQFPLGTNLVTWTATDNSGNTTTCQQRVIVRDNQPPTITCPTNVIVSSDAGVCFASGVVLGDPTAGDNCGSVTITNNAPASYPVGTNLVTWTATDASGNTATCVQSVIVLDTQPPVITCPTNLVLTTDPGQCSRSNVTFTVSATDLCGTVTFIGSVPASGSTFLVGVTTVTNAATDNSGNTAVCTFTVTVLDSQAPSITCPADVIIAADAGTCGATNVALGSPTASDNCGTVTVTNDAPAQFSVGTNVVTWTVTDGSGNTTTCQQRVTVRDTQAPTINCPGNIDVAADPGQCSKSNVTYTVTASDNCSGVTVVSIPPSGSTFPVGTTVVTNIATDASGNQTVCTFSVNLSAVTVHDTQPPVITCPSDLVLTADPGQCSRSNVTFLVTATDNCSVTNLVSLPPSGSTFPVGVTTVTNVATDEAGNQSSCTFTVTINDTESPVIVCPTNLVITADPGQCAATNVTFVVSATDNCGVTNLVTVPPSGSAFPVGITTVTNFATDSSGNTSSCTFTVTVQDTEAPSITCPGNIVVAADPGQCSKSNVTFVVTASDNCSGVTVVSIPPSGSTFFIGTTIVTNIATDASGNQTVCTFSVSASSVTVIDNQPPVITCPSDLVLTTDPGQCSRSNVTFLVTATDNCSVTNLVSIPPSGSTFPVGVTTVTNVATDAGGNQAACTFTVTIQDKELPVITCPTNLVLAADAGQCSRSNVTFVVGAADNCAVTNLVSVPASGSDFPLGVTTVTNTATDSSGNVSTCTFTVTVQDTQAPTLTCPPDITVSANPGVCIATGVGLGTPVTGDNCGAVAVTNDAPAFFLSGTNLVTWTATDSSGNSVTCAQTIIVIDTEPPTFTKCPANLALGCNPTSIPDCDLSPTNVAATDNCSGTVITCSKLDQTNGCTATRRLSYKATDTSGNFKVCTQTITWTVDTTAPVLVNCPAPTLHLGYNPTNIPTTNSYAVNAADGCTTSPAITRSQVDTVNGCDFTRTLTWVATDGCGNSASCSQFIDWTMDATPPTITCPALVTVPADAGTCSATNVNLGNLVATDNCGGALTITNDAPASFPVGTNTVTWTVTDAGGNTATCMQTVVVTDTQPPVITTCPAQVNVVVNDGACNATNVTLGTLVASDNCGGALTITNDAPASFPAGTNTVTWTVTDTHGNTATCLQTVVVTDTQPPVITTCPAQVNVVADAGTCAATNVNLGNLVASDNCGGTLTVMNNAPASFPVGTNTVTWTVSDAGGNTATCVQTVVVTDTQPPTITTCPAQVTVVANNGTCAATNVNLGNLVATDNCGGALAITNDAPASFPVGTNTVTWTVTDTHGNSATCQQTVVVTDTQPPTITTCPAQVNVIADAGTCAATNVNLGNLVATDNCGGALTITNDAPASFPAGSNTVTWSVSDASGNTATCVQTVVVSDTQPPMITTCPPQVNVAANAGTCAATNVNLGNLVATDNCGGTLAVMNNAPASFPVGTNLVTWTVTDASGNTATCMQTVVVTDTQPPVITTCPAQVNVVVNDGACNATNVTLGSLAATDNCGGALTITNDAPASFPAGTNTVTWTVTDTHGNTATCQQKVVVTDTQPPVITTCPAQVNVVADAGTCAATNVNLGTLVATDNCGGTLTITNNAPTSFPVGTNTVTWTVSDAGGNTATCQQTVVVTDTQPPTITTCPAQVNVAADAGTCAATNVNLGTLVATDNCGGALVVTNDAPATFPVGTNTVTWTVTDTHGNSATCVQTVVVTDTQPPVITSCPAQVNVVVNDGACNATNVTLGTLVASDNCGGALTITNDAPASFPAGTNTVTWTVTDTHGNTATCLQTVVVTDTQPPVITTCPAQVNVVADAGTCAATNVNLGNLVASDNCGGALTVMNNAPASFPVGTNTVTWTVSDAGGNTATCVQTVVVTDTQPPTITTCPAQVTVVANNGTCAATNVNLGNLVATDNCGGALAITNDAPASFPVGTNTVTWTVTDTHGNSATCQQTVVVTDTQPPTITTCPAQVNVIADAGTCAATNVNLGTLVATDNCGGALTITNDAPTSFPVGTNTVTWSVSDASGNTATCVQTVAVTDTHPPMITTCPPQVNVAANAGTCAATNVNLGNLVATDNCGGALTVTNNAPASFPVGTNTVTWTATDASGNSATCMQTVVVTDTQPPVITTCPAQVNVVVNDGACNATNVTLGTLTASDNCGGALTITNNAPASFPAGTNTVTWTVTDTHGNTATCHQTVVVTDTQPPVITTCPAQVNVVADAGTCAATNVNLGTLVATDNCGGTLTITNNAPTSFPVGTNTVTWTVSDAGGNTASCQQTVVVTDTQPPMITTCPAQVNVAADAGTCAATNVNLGTLVATDNCGGALVVTNDAPSSFPVGTNTVTWTVTDTHGNTSTCMQTVVVTDTQPPVITTCPAQVNVIVNDGACSATNVALGTLVATDNCGGALTITNNAPASFPAGTNTVTWTVTDTHGNTATCLQTVVVTDTQPPVITTCPAQVNVVADAGTCAATNVNLGNLVASDNCGGALVVTNDAPSSFPVGTNTVTWTVSDAGGNTATCVQTVVVTDTQPPTITTCPAQVTVVADNGTCAATNINLGNLVATDNCGGALAITNNAPASFPVGTNTVTWMVTDTHGNSATCQQTVVVTDTQPPTITTCPAQVNVIADAGTCAATNVNLGNLVATDNCGGALTITNNAPASFPLGTNLVTWTAYDSSGNTATCVQTVVVTDTQPPTITTCPAQVTVATDAGTCAATNVNLGNLVATDNCGGAVTITNDAPASFPLGTNTVTWTVRDASGNTTTCVQTVVITDTQPPTITCPPNITVTAAPDQATTNVTFSVTATDNCSVTNLVSVPPSGSAFAVGVTTVTNTATDSSGNTSLCTFTVTVLPGVTPPQFGILAGTNVFNPQTGLFEENVTVTNTGNGTVAAIRLLVGGLRTNVCLYNATGTNGGRPYAQCNAPLDPGRTVQFVLEFYVRDQLPFTNTLEVQAVLPDSSGTNMAGGVAISREFIDMRIAGNPRFVIEFASIPGRTYTILYSDDNMLTWKAATPSLTASATSTQWYDDGPPKTGSKPLSISSRLYRVYVAPANP